MSTSLKIFLLLVIAVLLAGCESSARADERGITEQAVYAQSNSEQHTKKIHIQQRDMMNRLKKIHTHLENKEKPFQVEPVVVHPN
jgi:outer membrane biogenesis lipoprotein LolB